MNNRRPSLGERRNVEIFPDGEIIVKDYLSGSRKIDNKRIYYADADSFNKLIKDIEICINSADSTVIWEDDSSGVLTIYHDFERVETMPRGLGNANVRIHGILTNYIYTYVED